MKRAINFKIFWRIVLMAIILLRLPGKTQENDDLRLFLDVKADTFLIQLDSTTSTIQLPHRFIIPRSETIFRNSFRLLRGINYRFFPRTGEITFLSALNKNDSLTIVYKKYPFPFITEYFHRQLIHTSSEDSSDSEQQRSTKIIQRQLFDGLDEYSSNLQRSGSIVRGFEIGNNRDLTLNSGLNLQLSGQITPNVELIAALTDESTPLQPEGNTQTLREVDKVFVKIKSPHLGGTLGDYNLIYQNSTFGDLRRKLQGISVNSTFGRYHQQLTYATSRGTFFSNQFLGQEGNQGPYQLLGKNGEREIIVLAGTEKVYVDGQLLIRGENNDYIIDYSLGQIIFTNQYLITSENRIEVDFEFANNFQRYGKNLLGFSASRLPSGNGFSYDFRFFREWDDTKNLLEDSAPLTEEEKQSLTEAGDDPTLASVNGAAFLGAGKGNYVLNDTLVSGENKLYYRYVGSNNGEYSVRFTSVGAGNGSYVRERLGVYRFVGEGKGLYLPVKLIPLAGDKKFGDLGFVYSFGKNFNLRGETALSSFDRNIFSGKDENDNIGKAFTLGASYNNETLQLFNRSWGKINWYFDWNQREENFSPLDRPYQPEYGYKWNLSSTSLLNQEQSVESFLNYQPVQFVQINLNGGRVKKGAFASSNRGRAQILLTDSTRVKGDIFAEKIRSISSREESDWIRTGGTIGKKIWKTLPYLQFRQEERQVEFGSKSLTGFHFVESLAGLKLFSVLGMNWHLRSSWRDDYLFDPDQIENKLKLSSSFTNRMNVEILNTLKWQGRFSFVFRDKEFDAFFKSLPVDSMVKFKPDPQFQDTTWNDRQSHLANLELNYHNKERTIDSRWNYKVASELQATQEKVFLEVEDNRGNYRYDVELQEYVPDPFGDFLLIVVPTGNFESVTNIEAGWQLRYRSKPTRQKEKGLKNVLQNLSFFTYLKVDEKSREDEIWQLYLLNLSKYHNIATTVRGSFVMNQDIYFFERNPDFGLTLRSRYRDNLFNQYVDTRFNENRKLWQRSLIWRQKIYKKVLMQEIEYEQSTNFRNVPSAPSRNRDVYGHLVNLKLNYRPVYAWQFRFELEGALQKDHAELNQLTVAYFALTPRINYAVKGKARAVASIDYLSVRIRDNPFNRPLPFEMGKGKKEGNSFNWNLRFEYFVSGNVTITVNYNGRNDAGMDRPIHLGQAEVRAFF